MPRGLRGEKGLVWVLINSRQKTLRMRRAPFLTKRHHSTPPIVVANGTSTSPQSRHLLLLRHTSRPGVVILLSHFLNPTSSSTPEWNERHIKQPSPHLPPSSRRVIIMPPLITNIFTADPSAHAFEGRVYIYPSHDRETDIAFNDNGDQYDMADYHVFSLDRLHPSPSAVTDHGVALSVEQVPWVSKQLWAPDAACKNGRYYLFFPARDRSGVFRVGVAEASCPEGPFRPDPEPLAGCVSIDPACFVDDDGKAYLYVGGLWGGQLQCYQQGPDHFDPSWQGPKEVSGPGVAAQGPLVGVLTDDMHSLDGPMHEVTILAPETGEPILGDDHDRRFFEASWMHKHDGKYYFSYSTGDTHFLVYATGDSPLGPFTYQGRILEPVLGWTTHHSIVEFDGSTYLFYHDCELSKGVDHLRSVKVKEIFYDGDGKIKTTTPD